MRTLLLSDLHLGCGACPGIFAGEAVLDVLLRHLGPEPLRVVLNGDTFDFPSQLHEGSGAVSVMRGFVEDAAVARLLARLAAIVAGGGELVLRVGEDDRELGDPRVQEVLVAGLCTGDAAAAARISIEPGVAPTLLEIGGVGVLVARMARSGDEARVLASHLLNPLRTHYGVGLAEMLRPDYAGAALAVLAVNPTAAKQVFRRLGVGARDPSGGLRLNLGAHLVAAGLSERERAVLRRALDPDEVLGSHAYDLLAGARLKLFRYSLGRQTPVDGDGLREIAADEWASLRRLARERRAAVVVVGGSHVPGWRADGGVTVADAGSWTLSMDLSRMRLASAERWRQTMREWQRIYQLDRLDPARAARVGVRSQIHALLLEPAAGGARLTLLACGATRVPGVLRAQRLPTIR